MTHTPLSSSELATAVDQLLKDNAALLEENKKLRTKLAEARTLMNQVVEHIDIDDTPVPT